MSKYSMENSHDEPLEEVSIDKWTDVQNAFKSDWLTSAIGSAVLGSQRELAETGCGYGFKLFCPFGRASSGMVALNEKDQLYEIIVQCPTDDTRDLEDALKMTKLIDWKKNIIVPFAPIHVIECIKRVIDIRKDVEIRDIAPSESFILQNKGIFFEVSLPSDITFGLLSLEHAELVNSCWYHKYPNSVWYFRLLINAKRGYGLFRDGQLISWVFINDSGILGHMYTAEKERRKGFADLILKMVCNILLREGKDVLIFCVKGNVAARNLYKNAGFMQYDRGVSWCHLKPKTAQRGVSHF